MKLKINWATLWNYSAKSSWDQSCYALQHILNYFLKLTCSVRQRVKTSWHAVAFSKCNMPPNHSLESSCIKIKHTNGTQMRTTHQKPLSMSFSVVNMGMFTRAMFYEIVSRKSWFRVAVLIYHTRDGIRSRGVQFEFNQTKNETKFQGWFILRMWIFWESKLTNSIQISRIQKQLNYQNLLSFHNSLNCLSKFLKIIWMQIFAKLIF